MIRIVDCSGSSNVSVSETAVLWQQQSERTIDHHRDEHPAVAANAAQRQRKGNSDSETVLLLTVALTNNSLNKTIHPLPDKRTVHTIVARLH